MLRTRLKIIAIGVTGALAAGAAAQSPGTDAGGAEASPEALAKRIERTLEELRSVRSERRAAREEHEQRRSGLERQIRRLEADRAAARRRRDEARRRLEKREKSLAAARERRAAARAFLDEAAKAAAGPIDAARARLEAGIPWKRAAGLERLGSAREALGAEAPGERGQGVERFLDWARTRLAKAASIETFHEPVVLADGDRRVPAHQLRIGLLQQAFVSEDGETIGIAAGGGKRWRLVADPALRRTIRRASAMARQKTAPSVIALPLPGPEGRE